MDCGAACLAMICRFYGHAVPLSHIREIAHTSTRGTTLNGITRAAEDLGLSACSIRASKSRLDELPLPVVVHWQGDHWVVLYRVEKKNVRVADPRAACASTRASASWRAGPVTRGDRRRRGIEQQPVQKVACSGSSRSYGRT